MASPEMEHRVSQLRHDVDDVYELLDATSKKVIRISVVQRQHGKRLDRLEEGQRRLEEGQGRLEDGQREQGTKLDEILAALDRRPAGEYRRADQAVGGASEGDAV